MNTKKSVSRTMTLRERLDFYSIPEPNSGCHLWTGALMGIGYGKLLWNYRQSPAHRLAWIEAHGEIPAGLLVLHKCDMPSCINTDHLFLGTDADNALDKAMKGRSTASFSKDDVIAIRRDSRSNPILAEVYGVHCSTISKIRLRKRYGWIQAEAPSVGKGQDPQ